MLWRMGLVRIHARPYISREIMEPESTYSAKRHNLFRRRQQLSLLILPSQRETACLVLLFFFQLHFPSQKFRSSPLVLAEISGFLDLGLARLVLSTSQGVALEFAVDGFSGNSCKSLLTLGASHVGVN